MATHLVIGYGNTLRSDDGAGYRLAETVAAWNLDGVRSLPVHQLTPELAANIADATTVIFVDATAPSDEFPSTVQLQPLIANEQDAILQHHADPRSLLALTRILFGKAPPAYHLLIPAESFDFGETFSPLTQAGIDEALEKIREFVNLFPDVVISSTQL